MKFILALVAFFAVIYILRKGMQRLPELIARELQKQRPSNEPAAASQTLVACTQCGVMVPSLDAVYRHGKPYCSQAHSD